MKVYIPQKQTSLCCFLVFFRARLREKFYRSQQKKRVFRWMLFVLIVFEKSRKSVKETPLLKKAR